MLVRAKWNVKYGGRWHPAGEEFQAETDLGDAVEVLEKPTAEKQEETPVPEAKPAEEKPKTTRRKR